LPEPFPNLASVHSEDFNPAIRLFGKRFIVEQGALELLAEFLAVVCCAKRIAGRGPIEAALPSLGDLGAWPGGEPLEYRPPIKLNLKLFALLGASRVDSRHDVHIEQHRRLTKALKERLPVTPVGASADEVTEWLEELLRGFQGAGFNRAWCAQTFLPITPALLTQETLWNETVARKQPVTDWFESIARFGTYYSISKHRFLARGGEVLYLQLCNALRAAPGELQAFVAEVRRQTDEWAIDAEEAEPDGLHARLQTGLNRLAGQRLGALDRLIALIEDLDPETKEAVNSERAGANDWLACEWCPRESWREGYLFAVELSRVLGAALAPVERLELLTTGCALQVLRSLCAQSARYAPGGRTAGPLGYAWVIAPPEGGGRALRQASHQNLQAVQALIQGALRAEALVENAKRDPDLIRQHKEVTSLYHEADTRYGHKLLLSLGKKLGLIVPYRGPGARFTMTEGALRYLVAALLRPGERCTYEEFLRRMRAHYGLAIEGEILDEAVAWSGLPPNRSLQPGNGAWLAATLRAGGFLTELADGCSVVRNTYDPLADEQEGGRG